MRHLVTSLIAIAVGCPAIGGYSAQPASSEADRQPQPSGGLELIVKMQELVFLDDAMARMQKSYGVTFPQPWSHAVITQQQAQFLTKAFQSDGRAVVDPLPTLRGGDKGTQLFNGSLGKILPGPSAWPDRSCKT